MHIRDIKSIWMKSDFYTWLLLSSLILPSLSVAQAAASYNDACFYDEEAALQSLRKLGPGWGYNYDSLMTDLEYWQGSPFVRIDSAGISVQGRTLWTLMVTDTALSSTPRTRISIHARTHPSEVQSSWVTREIIRLLISDSAKAAIVRKSCIFNFMPMYNPDGVELGYPRENANHFDLERNWDKDPHQPETAALKALFEEYMASESPVRVALNMHSSSAGARFFVFHHETGTSLAYTLDESRFIGKVRNYWMDGIADWDYSVTWADGTPTHFPESWFWLNYQEAVMALTYEDIYGAEDRDEFAHTARALLYGAHDYLFEGTQAISETDSGRPPRTLVLYQNYPNPFNGQTVIDYMLSSTGQVDVRIYTVNGQYLQNLFSGVQPAGRHHLPWNAENVSSGIYYCRVTSGGESDIKRLILVR